jgi:hypothetical protein
MVATTHSAHSCPYNHLLARVALQRHEQDTHADRATTATVVSLGTDGNGRVSVSVTASPVNRSWLVRLHLRPHQRLILDSTAEPLVVGGVAGGVRHIEPPSQCDDGYFPFRGEFASPPCFAGPVAEFRLAAGTSARVVAGRLV